MAGVLFFMDDARRLIQFLSMKKKGEAVWKRPRCESMEEFQVIDHCLMIRLPEEVDHHKAGFICEQADQYIFRESVDHVVFDFEDTRFMDSSGVGIIMGRYKKISCFGGKVYILHADKQIRRILKLSGMDKIVEVVEENK